jgi:DNA-binding transcriptional regulator YiaG
MDMGYSSGLNVSHNSKHTHSLGDCKAQIERITRPEGERVAELMAGLVIDRMRQVAGVKTDIALGAYFGLGTSAVSNWRQRQTVPFDECVNLSIRKGVSLDWLILGVGLPDASAADQRDSGALDERMQRMHQFLDHWDAVRGADDKVWLEMQLARAVPEYAEWVAARGK